jgi:hypothetical protein
MVVVADGVHLAVQPAVGHVGCVERAGLVIENGFVVGWNCHCCSCGDEGFSVSCRNHGGAHIEDGCERHRQPATTTCGCGCGL